jgi:sugar phosphate permease
MKAKKALFLMVSLFLIGTLLYVLMNLIGVQVVGANWAKYAFFVATGFSGIVLWEFYRSVS